MNNLIDPKLSEFQPFQKNPPIGFLPKEIQLQGQGSEDKNISQENFYLQGNFGVFGIQPWLQ
jgi:hypothetical protein